MRCTRAPHLALKTSFAKLSRPSSPQRTSPHIVAQAHRPLYRHAERSDVWLSVTTKGEWLVQEGPDFGTDRAFFALADPCVALPHLSTAAWRAWSGTDLKLEPLLTMTSAPADDPPKKRKHDGDEGGDEKSDQKSVKKELKVAAAGSGGGVHEADDDLEVTGSKSAADKNAALRAGAIDVS